MVNLLLSKYDKHGKIPDAVHKVKAIYLLLVPALRTYQIKPLTLSENLFKSCVGTGEGVPRGRSGIGHTSVPQGEYRLSPRYECESWLFIIPPKYSHFMETRCILAMSLQG